MEKLIFADIDYSEIKNKPSSTITQIDDAVAKRHKHSNKNELDGISESNKGILMYKGEEYIRKSDFVLPQKQFLYGRLLSGGAYNHDVNIKYQRHSGNIPLNTTKGVFTLEAGKAYHITANFSLGFNSNAVWCRIQLADNATGKEPVESPNRAFFAHLQLIRYSLIHSMLLYSLSQQGILESG